MTAGFDPADNLVRDALRCAVDAGVKPEQIDAVLVEEAEHGDELTVPLVAGRLYGLGREAERRSG